jgi:hypothetical protein
MRTTITKLTLIATATVALAIVLPATAHAYDGSFQSPSGNIYCLTATQSDGTNRADCQVQRHTYAVPPPNYVATDGSPAVCHLGGWGSQFSLTQGNPAQMVCQGGVLTVPPMPTLDYGQTRSVGAITCDSEPSGMTCTDSSTGHFFRASRDSYQLG